MKKLFAISAESGSTAIPVAVSKPASDQHYGDALLEQIPIKLNRKEDSQKLGELNVQTITSVSGGIAVFQLERNSLKEKPHSVAKLKPHGKPPAR